MPKRIERLTKKQESRMDAWADAWIDVGLCTDPADRPRFEAGAEACYKAAGLSWHGRVVWVDNPLVVSLAGPAASELLKNEKATQGEIRDAIKSGWGNILGGQFWCAGYWWGPAFTSFFREVCKLELDCWDAALANEETVKSACWWWPHSQFVIVSERPKAIHLEQVASRGWGSHRLHNPDGPAIEWEGWSVYAWHGTRVPGWIIEHPESITADAITDEKNQEVRRVMIEKIGWDRYLDMAKAKPIQSDAFGELYAIPWEDSKISVVVVNNSTPEPDGSTKRYALTVPESCKTAHEAVASTFGMSSKEYQPRQQT